MKTTSLAASDPQAAQKRALALVQSLTPAVKFPLKPFVHLAANRIGSCAFVVESLDKARETVVAFGEAGYVVTFAVWMNGRDLVPLYVQDKAFAA